MREVDSLAFNKILVKDIDKLRSSSRKIGPDNINVFSYDFAVDTDNVSGNVPYAGQAMINSVDVSKLNAAIACIKSHKQLYRNDLLFIPRFDFDNNMTNGETDSTGVLISMSTNNSIFDITVPEGWSGQNALVSWHLARLHDKTEIVNYNGTEQWLKYFARLWNSDKETSVGMNLYQNETFIRLVFTYNKIEEGWEFPA